MRRVYMSFLGLGRFNKETQQYEYQKTIYDLNGTPSQPTRFIQAAELELLGQERPDIAYILATEESRNTHFSALAEEMARYGVTPHAVQLDENMSSMGQWQWFETIIGLIKPGDRLILDFTHGYRSLPIIYSSALNLLQKARGVTLEHVFYGAFEQNRERPPIIDMRAFYDIDIWADAVTRLTEDADAAGISEAAARTNVHQFPELTDQNFTEACTTVTQRIKSVDVNNVADAVNELLAGIGALEQTCLAGTSVLLQLIRDKFAPLVGPATTNPDRNGYTLDHFQSQLSLARLLMDHGLYMQAYTVMREWLGSLIMLHLEATEKLNTEKRRKRCAYYTSTFFDLLQFPEEKWNFKNREDKFEKVHPFYEKLKENGVLDPLLAYNPLLAKELSDYRNGFDHAWLGKSGMKDDLDAKGFHFLKQLENVFESLKKMKSFTIE